MEEKKGNSPPAFPGADEMKAQHERFLRLFSTEQGKQFLKEHVSPDVYKQFLKDIGETE